MPFSLPLQRSEPSVPRQDAWDTWAVGTASGRGIHYFVHTSRTDGHGIHKAHRRRNGHESPRPPFTPTYRTPYPPTLEYHPPPLQPRSGELESASHSAGPNFRDPPFMTLVALVPTMSGCPEWS